MNKKTENIIWKPLRSFVAGICICATLLGIVTPAIAAEIPEDGNTEITEIVSETAVETIAETTETDNQSSSENTLLAHLRQEIAAYMEIYQISPEMPDNALANAYFVLDSQGAKAAWDTANELLAQAQELSAGDADILNAEKNTILCLRFYDIMTQINFPVPAALSDSYTVTPAEGRTINVSWNTVSDNNVEGNVEGNDVIVTATTKSESNGCGGTSDNPRTVTITVSNGLSEAALISFDWMVSWEGTAGTVKFGGDDKSSSGKVTKIRLEAGKAYSSTLEVTTHGSKGSKATITLSNFQSIEPPKSAKVSFVHDTALGDITVGGTAIDGATSEEITIGADGIAVSATPASGVTFLGWIDETSGKRYSPDASATILPPESNTTIRALFIDSDSPGWYLTSGTHLFSDLNTASDFAAEETNGNVILLNNATLPAGTYTLHSGVTLLIPFDANHTLYKDAPLHDEGAKWVQPTAYRTLTMATGAKITVETGAAISLSAKHHSGSAAQNAGSPTGSVSFIDMQEGSSITVNSGASLYAWGYITGDGSVTIENGGNVYENLQVNDFRGGSHTAWIAALGGKNLGIFPFNSYFVQNIEVPMTVKSGATETCYASINASSHNSTGALFIAKSGAMFNCTEGYIIKRYDGESDRLVVDVYGSITIAPLSLNVGGYDVNSSGFILPINSNITVAIHTGTITVNQNLELLPGASISIAEGAKMTLASGKKVYVYDSDQWRKEYLYPQDATYHKIAYAPGRVGSPANPATADATILVNGTLDCSAGAIYTTSSGANICSTEKGTIILTAGTETSTKQVTKLGSGLGFTAGTTENIPITPAKLKNEDGSYLSTGSTTYYYGHHGCKSCSPTCAGGIWTTTKHEDSKIVTNPTCTDRGYTTYTCACGHKYTGNQVSALGHTPGTPVITDEVLPTYQNEGSHVSTVNCSVCGEMVSSETVIVPKVVQLNAYAASAAAEVYLEMKFFLPEEMANGTINLTHTVTKDGNTTMDNETYQVSSLTTDASGRYVISHGIASGEMTCPVIVTFKDSNGKLFRVRTGSTSQINDFASCKVTDYAELVLTKGNADQKNLITNLLTYGGYAQALFKVDESNPAYNILSTYGINKPDINQVTSANITNEATEEGGNIGIKKSAQNAFLASAIYHRVYFKLGTGCSIDNFKFVLTYPVNYKEKTIEVEPVYDSKEDRYYVTIEDIPAAYLDYDYKITVTNTETNETYTVTTSILAYLKAILSSADATAEQKDQARAMYLYNQAANDYFKK